MNNRQAGRRRGRGNSNRNQGNRGGGGIDRENRIDNRARGNAAQMLEKYKKMAQDAQVNGDRVNAEYYHQFADHYFRVHADTQARREEQRQVREEAREERRSDDGDQDRGGRDNKGRSRSDADRNDADQADQDQVKAGKKSADKGDEKKPVRSRRPRKSDEEKVNGAASEGNGLDASALPPAISADAGKDVEASDDDKPVRKRRTVKAEAPEEGDAA